MKVLIAGGGVAGLTLAALLRPRGHQITVVDPGHGSDDGFALALWPHGTRVLHAVGVHDRLVERGLPMRRYTARSGSGALLTTSGPPAGIARHGYLGTVPRSDLVEMLATACDHVEHRTGRVVALEQHHTGVDAHLDGGTIIEADLLVGADGIGSAVRTALLGPQPRHDTGWTCATWWTEAADHPGDAGETLEFWGAGSFVGCYPCRGRSCLIVGGPSDTVRGQQARPWLRRTLTGAGLPADRLLPGSDDERWLWPMTDVRSTRWVRDRVALVGDAAAAFLPTAGMGASMALESAAALADELSRCDAGHAPFALRRYERRRKGRVERAQRQSRHFARALFTSSSTLARLRNGLVARMSVDRLLAPLVRDLDHPA